MHCVIVVRSGRSLSQPWAFLSCRALLSSLVSTVSPGSSLLKKSPFRLRLASSSSAFCRPAGSFWNEFRRLDNGFHEFSSTPNIYKAHFRPENTSTISFCRHLDSDRPGAVRIPVNTNCLFTSHTALNNAQTTEKSEVRGRAGEVRRGGEARRGGYATRAHARRQLECFY